MVKSNACSRFKPTYLGIDISNIYVYSWVSPNRKDNMPVVPGIIYRANIEDGESVFYRELMETIAPINAVREASGEAPLTYRQVVTEGLGLPDSFTGKIKSGKYVPTKDKLEACAAFLGVRPEGWDTYVRRYANERLNDPAVIELFRLLASLPVPADSIVLKGVLKWANKMVGKAKPHHPSSAAA